MMEERFVKVLKKVVDPELGINVVDLGLIYRVDEKEGEATVAMTATTPFCPYLPQLLEEVQAAIESLSGIKRAKVEVVWQPPWDLEKMSLEAKAQLGIL